MYEAAAGLLRFSDFGVVALNLPILRDTRPNSSLATRSHRKQVRSLPIFDSNIVSLKTF